jgi:glycine cleavage system aminomethyltransferase T
VSGHPVLNWVKYQAEANAHDVELTVDPAFNLNATGRRKRYRFELAGPAAKEIFHRAVDGGAPDILFFRMATVRMKGHDVLVLRHGMVGSFAVEISGPYEEQDAVRSHILEVGAEFGIRPMGMRAYYTTVQSGWIPYPVPGILTDPALEDYRRYLPAKSFEAGYELGGSFLGTDISQYYATPYDFGYERIIKFDHDFHGREALQRMPEEAKRKKVTLVWDRDDVMRVMRSQFGSGPRYKSIDFPTVGYAWKQFDEVRSRRGDLVGVSLSAAYLNPLGDVISMSLIDSAEQAATGNEVVITWGEPGGGSRKPQIERHAQTTIRARVAPAPYQSDIQRLSVHG